MGLKEEAAKKGPASPRQLRLGLGHQMLAGALVSGAKKAGGCCTILLELGISYILSLVNLASFTRYIKILYTLHVYCN